ncbi:MAG TPA: N-methyl-L-tryptophan oxidase [Casimicrobiaceae bacterium]|nr:N-methyl-L-tryptophan oxidase [Casimicrobiaceae bacterium]
MRSFDTIVLGLGAMGSAALYHLARRGIRALGLDRFSPPHDHGSTHGDSRITRLAIGEGEQYTPLALRSHALWRELEAETGDELLTVTGCLVISSRSATSHTHVEHFFDNTLAAARRFGIAHELLDAAEIRRRFPQFRLGDAERGYLERDAGFVRPERCVAAQLREAERRGATIRRSERALAFRGSAGGVSVTTDRDSYAASTLIVAAGPWLPGLLDAALARHFTVYRQTMFWFALDGGPAPFEPGRCPVFIWELTGRKQGIYGFPAIDGASGGIKVATEAFEAPTDAEAVSRNVSREEIRTMYEDYVAPQLAGVAPRCLRALTCLYTVTADFGFVIDRHPEFERVLIASPCSGHGFKHSPAIGEALADLATGVSPRFDASSFALRRFAGTTVGGTGPLRKRLR